MKNKRYKILSMILIVCSGCHTQNADDNRYIKSRSLDSQYRQYDYDRALHRHHNDIKTLQNDVDQLIDDMDHSYSDRSSNFHSNNHQNHTKNRNHHKNNNANDKCSDKYITYVKLLNNDKAIKSIVLKAYRRYKACKYHKTYSQNR